MSRDEEMLVQSMFHWLRRGFGSKFPHKLYFDRRLSSDVPHAQGVGAVQSRRMGLASTRAVTAPRLRKLNKQND